MTEDQRALLLKAAASLEADYDYVDTVTAERAAEQIQRAEAFLQAAERYLGPPAPWEDEPTEP